MTLSVFLQRWSATVTLIISLTVVLGGCAKVPRYYVMMAESGVTLTALTTSPEHYRGKVVLMGGTIVEEEESEQHISLRVKNRPLDQDYVPHRPADEEGPEAGHYWVIIPKQRTLPAYREWARMTVVGRVTGAQWLVSEPVLSLLYVRGWGVTPAHDAVWADSIDPNYIPSVPAGIGGGFNPR